MDRGSPISYMVLAAGTRVESSDGHEVGTVHRVLQVPEKDVFDGIVIQTPAGSRFADGPEVAEIYERLVVLSMDGEAASKLPEPDQNPGTLRVSADDLAGRGRGLWNRITGRG